MDVSLWKSDEAVIQDLHYDCYKVESFTHKKRAFVKREKKVKRANTRQDKEHDIRNIPLKKEGDDYEI